MSNYIRGPWAKSGFDIIGANGKRVVICEGPAFGSKSSFPEAQANSDLIMTAPDLLEALEDMVNEAEQAAFEAWVDKVKSSGDCDSLQHKWKGSWDYSDFLDLYKKQISAIAKAKGE